MYIRVKRMKTTYFIQCDPTETVLDVKQKLFTLIEQPVSNQRLVLMSTEEVLEDSKSLAEQKVSNVWLPLIFTFPVNVGELDNNSWSSFKNNYLLLPFA